MSDVTELRKWRNAKAVEEAAQILTENRIVTEEDRLRILEEYTGVGGLVEIDQEKFGQMAALQQSKASLGQYLTPLPAARFLVDALAITDGSVYDNCAGAGRLFAYLPKNVDITAIELQDEAFGILKALYDRWPGGSKLIHGDCLEYRSCEAFDYALGNPPFGLTWSVEDTAGLESASRFKGHVLSLEAATELQVRAVKPGGFLALVVPETAMEREDLRHWREYVQTNCDEMALIHLPNSGDEDPGTRWLCVAWLLQKHDHQPTHYPRFEGRARSWEELNGAVAEAWARSPWYERVVVPYGESIAKKPAPASAPAPGPEWKVILSTLRWKKNVLLGTAKVLERVRTGPEILHEICCIGRDEYWCMTCESSTCNAIEEVLRWQPKRRRQKKVQAVVEKAVRRIRTLGDVPTLTAPVRSALRQKFVEVQKALAEKFDQIVGWQRPEKLQHVKKRYKAFKPLNLSSLPLRGKGLTCKWSGKSMNVVPLDLVSALMLSEATGSTVCRLRTADMIMGGEEWLPLGSPRHGWISLLGKHGLSPVIAPDTERAIKSMRRELAWQLVPRAESSDDIPQMIERAKEMLGSSPVVEYLPTAEEYEQRYWYWRELIASTNIDLYEYQAHDAALMCLTRSTYLSYTPGLGKTRTSIAVALARHADRKAHGHDFKALFVVPPGSVLDMAWADECKLIGLKEGEDFIIVHNPSDMLHPAPLHITSYTKIANKPKPVQFDPIICPRCGELVTGEKCDNPDCGAGFCPKCGQSLDSYGRCRNPRCDNYAKRPRITAWKRALADLCPQCGLPTWKGHICTSCGYSDRTWVPSFYKRAAKAHYDLVALDEAHYIKNSRTLRGDAALALRGAKYKIALGGTPVMGFIQDFCKQGQFLFDGEMGRVLFPFPMDRGNQKAFMDTFAFYVEKTMKNGKRRKVQEAERIRNAELFWRITDTCMIRRQNDDDMVAEAIKLPSFNQKEVAVQPNAPQLKVIRWVEGKFLELYRQQLENEARGESFNLGSFSALMWAARRAATVPSFFAEEYPQEEWPKLDTWPKIEAIEETAKTCIAQGRKLVIFTGLNPAAAELVRRLQKYDVAPIPLTHLTPPGKRTKILRDFRSKDSPRIIVMGLLCGNVGLTLTSPNYPIDVLIVDLDWSPSQIAQAVKRVYRPSQRFDVNAYTVLTQDSMDMDMWDLVYRKSKGIAQALDKVNPDEVEKTKPLSQREMLDELAKRITLRQMRNLQKPLEAAA